jgi:hypothetical protein
MRISLSLRKNANITRRVSAPLAFLALCCALAILAAACGNKKPLVRVSVRARKDISGLDPNSKKLYLAFISNQGSAESVLEVVRMGGGYVGSGVFFPCSLEEWNPGTKAWRVLRQTTLEGSGGRKASKEVLKPGDTHEACRYLLPYQGGHEGSCMRFRISSTFGKGGQFFYSPPFLIGGEPNAVLPCKEDP